MNIELFLIEQSAPLREALAKIEANKHGIVFVTNESAQVIGVVTDGDIRRQLLEGLNLDSQILNCANKNFTWANEKSTREKLLKQLDSRIRVIPILREDRTLASFVSRDDLPFQEEEKVYARARSPVRISFGGGGSDLTHYFSDDRGAVINTTISLYSHATLRVREDKRILIRSKDIGASIEFEDIDSAVIFDDKFRLIQSVIKVAKPDYGFELFIYSDFPMNSGLGGSAVVSSAILGCFNQFRRDKWDHHEIAELAFQAERLHLGISGGWQDQYATVFGGFNFMEFQLEQNIVHPLRIARDTMIELEECLLLCDTNTTHDSGNIHDDQRVQMQKEDVKKKVFENVELTYEMRNHLLRGRLFQFGKCLHRAWEIKRGLGKKITNNTLDSIYYGALENGAIGGKLLGAGGGGFFLFYVPPFAKNDLMEWVEKQGLGHKPFRFDSEGLQAWTVREIKNHEDMKY